MLSRSECSSSISFGFNMLHCLTNALTLIWCKTLQSLQVYLQSCSLAVLHRVTDFSQKETAGMPFSMALCVTVLALLILALGVAVFHRDSKQSRRRLIFQVTPCLFLHLPC